VRGKTSDLLPAPVTHSCETSAKPRGENVPVRPPQRWVSTSLGDPRVGATWRAVRRKKGARMLRLEGFPLWKSVSSLCRGHANLLCIAPDFRMSLRKGRVTSERFATLQHTTNCVWMAVSMWASIRRPHLIPITNLRDRETGLA